MQTCQHHPKYQGLTKPRFLNRVEGCIYIEELKSVKQPDKAMCQVCYQIRTDFLKAQEVHLEIESHLHNFMYSYRGTPYDVKRMTLPSVENDYDLLSKVFKAQHPGIGCLLKIYKRNEYGRVYFASIYASTSERRSGLIRTVRSSSKAFTSFRDEAISPLDI